MEIILLFHLNKNKNMNDSDAIDAGSNKKAMQEADKVLKKHPTTHCAKVLIV